MDWLNKLALETLQPLGRQQTTVTATARRTSRSKRYSRAELQQIDRELKGARRPSSHAGSLNEKLKQSKRTASGLTRDELRTIDAELREGR